MAKDTYSEETIVLGKTKLGEADCIVRMLGRSGELVEAVAKGARKPSSVLSARLELGNRVQLLIARGKSLDIIQESRLVSAHERLHREPAYLSGAACICEFASKAAQRGLEMPRFFELTAKAIDSAAEVPVDRLCLIVAAYLLKASSMLGVRPSFSECVVCGDSLAAEAPVANLSVIDGGAVCASCVRACETEECAPALVTWAQHALFARFDDLTSGELTADAAHDARLGEDVLALALSWVQAHFGMRLKSARSLVQYCML